MSRPIHQDVAGARAAIEQLWARGRRLRDALAGSIHRDGAYYLLLAGLFLISFSIPIVVAVQVSDRFIGNRQEPDVAVAASEEPAPSTPEASPEVAAAEVATGGGALVSESSASGFALATFDEGGEFLRISHAASIAPTAEDDLCVVLWFKPRRLPGPGEVMVLLSKVDSSEKNKPGYQLTLVRDSGALRPQVYWRTPARLGGVYNFSDIHLEPHAWAALAMSVRRGRYLGLHLIEYATPKDAAGEATVTLLGGYDLGRQMVASSTSDLLVGPFNKNLFRGAIGPVGILRGQELSGGLREALQGLAEHPRDPLSVVPSDLLQFWTVDGKTDLSGHGIPVVVQHG